MVTITLNKIYSDLHHIEKVANSCITLAQLENTMYWIKNIIGNWESCKLADISQKDFNTIYGPLISAKCDEILAGIQTHAEYIKKMSAPIPADRIIVKGFC